MKEKLLAMKNKEFAYKCIEIIIAQKREDDILMLTNSAFCKKQFDMNYTILREVPLYGEISEKDYRDNSFNRRYYPQPITAFGKRYIVCNDWYYMNKVNPRDTRSNFVNWVLK